MFHAMDWMVLRTFLVYKWKNHVVTVVGTRKPTVERASTIRTHTLIFSMRFTLFSVGEQHMMPEKKLSDPTHPRNTYLLISLYGNLDNIRNATRGTTLS